VLPIGKVLELQGIGADGRPLFYITNNYDAADTVSTDELWPGGSTGLNLTGIGLTIGEWDAGAVEVLHPDLYLRATQIDDPNEISGHSTHVAGTLIGSGTSLYLQARGMAYEADLVAYDWNLDAQEMVAAALNNMLVSNHSYGIAAGWIAVGGAPPDNWWWIGGPGDEDPNFGYYDYQAQTWDQVAYDAPHYLIVKAAGNDRWDIGPNPDEEYSIVDQDGVLLGTSSMNPPPADCAQTGYDCLPTASVAKNILTIGAVDDVPGGYLPLAGPSGVQMTGFSSFGPADDGRIKPDLVANGWLLFSTYPWEPYFASAIGTSMAAPNVSGSLLLLQQHYEILHGADNFMRAATLKALAIHTADETGSAQGPDYEYGWGLLNAKQAAKVISEDGNGTHQIIEDALNDGATDSSAIIDVTEDGQRVTVTLVWNDPPGTPVPPALDPANLMLVNDLDLRVLGNGDTHLPWVLSPAAPGAPASRGDNFRDNVEQVEFTASVGSYSVQISHEGNLATPQDYALIISIAPPAPTSTGLALDEDFSLGVLPPGWSTDTTSLVNWTIRLPQPGGGRYDNNTGGSGGFAMLDNNFAKTVASLYLPPLDLSASESVVIRFRNSFPYFDLFESINVDTSVDGGANWSTAWSTGGFIPAPFQVVQDLTVALAGESDARIRFRWDSAGDPQGDAWQFDEVEVETFGGQPPTTPPPTSELPGQADNPTPTSGTTELDINPLLTWSAGPLADSHKLYLGTDSNLSGGDYLGNMSATQYSPAELTGDTLYFWRVDEVNSEGETAGINWSFTTVTAPEPPPTPTMHVADLDGWSNPQPRNRWEAEVQVLVVDETSQPVSGATVAAQWSDGTNGSPTCNTIASGHCSFTKANLKGGVATVTLSVTNVTHGSFDYQAGDNMDPDGDSNNGTVIVIGKNDTPATNAAPVVNITSPENGAEFTTGNGIVLTGNAQDAESGNLSSAISWRVNGSDIGNGASLTHDFPDGSHTVEATAFDPEGANGSASISITVGESGGTPTATIVALTDESSVPTRNWSAIARIVIEDDSGVPISGATVSASWSEGAKGGASCTTVGGSCQLVKNRLKLNVPNVRITIDNISLGGANLPFSGLTSELLTQ
jgi:hypothetical protein